MKYFLPLFILLLAGCGGGTIVPTPIPAPVPVPAPVVQPAPSDPSWKMTPGSYAIYQSETGVCTVDPTTGIITPVNLTNGNKFRITNLATTMPGSNTPAIARVYSAETDTATVVNPTLTSTLVELSTGSFIGEAANVDAQNISPPEPLLATPAVAGQSFSETSTVTPWSGSPYPFTTEFWVIATNYTSDGSQGTLTGLIENPGTSTAFAYDQLFDGEVVSIVYGAVVNGTTIPGCNKFYRLSIGQNP